MPSTSDLKIVDIIPKSAQNEQHPRVKHPILPQHEFSMLIVAPKGSGKTNLICNMLLNHYKGYFHQIWVVCPTVENDPKWDVVKSTKGLLVENKALKKALGEKTKVANRIVPKIVHKSEGQEAKHVEEGVEENKFDGRLPADAFFDNMDEIPKRLQKQREVVDKLHELHVEKKSRFLIDRILVILDDQAGQFKGGNVNNPMVNYVIKHRHYNTSLMVVTQAYKAIPKSIRTNMNALICFEVPNQAELDVIYEEWPEDMNEIEWLKVYRAAVHEPFSFLYLNNHFKKGERAHKNFEYKLKWKDTPVETEPVK